MESSGDIQLPDMNISGHLKFYGNIIDFENDTGKHELIFGNLDRSQQRAVQSIAHSSNLDYEYQQGYAKVLQPWPQYSVYPYPLELPSELAQDNVASESLPLPQSELGSQFDMPEYDIYGNSSALNGCGTDYSTHVGEEVTLAQNLGTPRISSDNSGYGPIQQNIQRQAYVCKTCQKSYSREIYLRRHERIHAEGNHMKCSSCAERVLC
ncbi:hypothetical protein EAF00_011572 [Botryotinia globosa]|nr:hypothetical protein EAF00_011572 [Botryotinia globosa]